jgi:putative copper export protein
MPALAPRPYAPHTRGSVYRLHNNSLTEAAIGAIILIIVGLLGTLPPALHDEVAGMARTGL